MASCRQSGQKQAASLPPQQGMTLGMVAHQQVLLPATAAHSNSSPHFGQVEIWGGAKRCILGEQEGGFFEVHLEGAEEGGAYGAIYDSVVEGAGY